MDVCVEEGFEIAAGRTAGPSTALLRSSGRDDKGNGVTFWKIGDLDGQSGTGSSATTAGPSTALLRSFGRDDKGERRGLGWSS
jgi:hypothetical protein